MGVRHPTSRLNGLVLNPDIFTNVSGNMITLNDCCVIENFISTPYGRNNIAHSEINTCSCGKVQLKLLIKFLHFGFLAVVSLQPVHTQQYVCGKYTVCHFIKCDIRYDILQFQIYSQISVVLPHLVITDAKSEVLSQNSIPLSTSVQVLYITTKAKKSLLILLSCRLHKIASNSRKFKTV
ncbi:Hypothetical_protein [Hexamita inflata]|uniref:Hypothetical_protein n=1 Tax=Hexamita inflata TaxID=28002 RepID=A0AA86QB06_9EUKA|nr:Hypothetical protein HINF_LOCUS41336 [Hexamita inflata]